eukprot:TRINITY_DN69481_c0_g1_i1.p1 TRINITY_DN69481_c0_g1~~TRINITY_DN69481_c0_g1_i1.p1  ORF type:complete len:346 (-),score=94.28 TRINITY_DN69481_c0_g1_i1:617-1615(-)
MSTPATQAAPAKPEIKYVKLSFFEDFMLSGCAAVTSKTLAAPIERLKMVKQNEDELVKRGTIERPFRGVGECASWIAKNEGMLAFWKSNFTNCIRYFPTQALNFSLLPQYKKIEALKPSKADSFGLSLLKNVTSGGMAGGTSLLFVYSLDYARTRLANDLKSSKKGAASREFTGLADVYKKTWAAEGIQGLYAGFNISFIGIFVYRGLYFGLFHTVMPLFPEGTVNAFTRFAVGYVVTVLAGLASYPIDTIRRRMMMVAGGDASLKYNSSLDCFRYILKNDGAAALFKGAGANILRGVAGAGVLALFDSFVQKYVQMRYGEGYKAKISGGGG